MENKENKENNSLFGSADDADELPQQFFVYGTLRDDDDSNVYWRKNWIKNGIAQNAKLIGFKLILLNCKKGIIKDSNPNVFKYLIYIF